MGANITLIQSDRKLSRIELQNKRSVDPFYPDSRALYDQSPYIINLDLSYDHPKSGTSFTIAANLTGARLALVKTLGEDIYEHPPITLDAMINQKFCKHWTIRFGVRNILDSKFLQTYGSSTEGKIFQAYHYGRTYGVALTGEF